MRSEIKDSLINMSFGFGIMAFAFVIAVLLGDDFRSIHSWIDYVLSPLIVASYLFAVLNIVRLVFNLFLKLLHILYLWLDSMPNNEDVSKAKRVSKRLKS
ncbi:hypothetical protein ACPG5S_21880 [Enterobacter cloacae complex sp. 2025EL-00025]|uniref:hypothetical protein n=1 Tax=Enterobacteriaceae TaxID=543 RepID=UPI000E342260|nr:hypothetical protein [Klebsiella pneumoniae]EBC4198945.1 hypothetical protein [Salmonella enterica]EBZ7010606.1 hypothetical protein [Salmonella enterica subsp. enterica serovar Infantis]ECT9048428.1 hypothetical protein [Salmonella enterica subsp. enterica serovar Oranienburg]EDK1096004.1 hypothetical protein [Salmonella enterica subsp. enterica serovar Schwarzengrund]EKS8451459.1 hypothetical protein [Salmonella enterica subsp. enterica serovar Cerro]HCL1467858.1 hypothetical protein [Sa